MRAFSDGSGSALADRGAATVETLARLAALGATACASRRWARLRAIALLIAPLLRERLRLLAQEIAYLVEDGSPDLAADLWWHLHDFVASERPSS